MPGEEFMQKLLLRNRPNLILWSFLVATYSGYDFFFF